MLSAKEIYERVSGHLLTQRIVSEDENGSCRLRCVDGRKCAIGSLIRDDLYCPVSKALASHTIGTRAMARSCGRRMHLTSTFTMNISSNC
jgi:hypothetical protein